MKFTSSFEVMTSIRTALFQLVQLQVNLCTPDEIQCVSNINIDKTNCLPKCSGLQISNYVQESIPKNKELYQNMDTYNSMQLEAIKKISYKGFILPSSLKSWSMIY